MLNKKGLVGRDLFSQLFKHLFKSEITLLVGARQVGKTVLLEMLKDGLIKKGISPPNILYFNLDIMQTGSSFRTRVNSFNSCKSVQPVKKSLYLLMKHSVHQTAQGFSKAFTTQISMLNLSLQVQLP